MEDGFILINTFDGSAKVKNAKRDRRVALSITDMYNTYNMVSIKGKVVDIHQMVPMHICRNLQKSTRYW